MNLLCVGAGYLDEMPANSLGLVFEACLLSTCLFN